MGLRKIVVTGAPGTGKTSVIDALENKGHHCFHEIIRSMTARARSSDSSKPQISNPLAFVDDPYKFNQVLLQGRLKHFQMAEELGLETCFFDRGMPDVLAYMDFFHQEYGQDFIDTCEKNKYDAIFILPPWKDIYTTDHERLESYEQAEELHEHLLNTYRRFGYQPIVVPKGNVESRVNFILDHLNCI
ncbi:ATP-binding protein [Allomuricauda sp. d1]|uniref:ATP-binding protein n=1 Tax=Allomuricauda sp. d1 TaxID=3136725 RepID=UPI0031DA9170